MFRPLIWGRGGWTGGRRRGRGHRGGEREEEGWCALGEREAVGLGSVSSRTCKGGPRICFCGVGAGGLGHGAGALGGPGAGGEWTPDAAPRRGPPAPRAAGRGLVVVRHLGLPPPRLLSGPRGEAAVEKGLSLAVAAAVAAPRERRKGGRAESARERRSSRGRRRRRGRVGPGRAGRVGESDLPSEVPRREDVPPPLPSSRFFPSVM